MDQAGKKMRRERGLNFTWTFIALIIIVTAFFSIYNAAQKRQPGNAVIAGVSLFAGAILLDEQLRKARQK